MRTPYRQIADLPQAAAWLRELGARSVLLDVEPLVAAWDTDSAALRAGVESTVALLAEVPGVEVVAFATNSLRRFAGAVPGGGFFVTAARKPLLRGPYRDLPRPGVLVGDQLVTDGLLARRLGFAFAHVHSPLLRRLLFDPS